MSDHLSAKKRRRFRAELRERDGDGCWLCGVPMEFGKGPAVGPPPDLFATIDRVIPQSQGGGHDMPNLRLAHSKCNKARGGSTDVPISEDAP